METDFTQTGIADTRIENARPGTIVVVPDHRGQAVVVTECIGQLATGELEIVHKVVNPLKLFPKRKVNATNDVLEMNPGIDVIAVLAN